MLFRPCPRGNAGRQETLGYHACKTENPCLLRKLRAGKRAREPGVKPDLGENGPNSESDSSPDPTQASMKIQVVFGQMGTLSNTLSVDARLSFSLVTFECVPYHRLSV